MLSIGEGQLVAIIVGVIKSSRGHLLGILLSGLGLRGLTRGLFVRTRD